jgi:hypothetical protein
MPPVAKKTAERISAALKRFQPILEAAKARDVNESDTVVIVTDLLADLFGFDKYTEITSEYAIRGTYCDLAIKIDSALALLIEVKAIGSSLKEQHVKQAVDYAANQGCEWVVLTNGLQWQAYRISFAKPISAALVVDLPLLDLSHRKDADIERLWLLSREGLAKAGLADYHAQREALSRFAIAALLQSDPVLDLLRREIRKVSPDAKVATEEIAQVLTTEVIKRECLEGERAEAARRAVNRAAARAVKKAATVGAATTADSADAASAAIAVDSGE